MQKVHTDERNSTPNTITLSSQLEPAEMMDPNSNEQASSSEASRDRGTGLLCRCQWTPQLATLLTETKMEIDDKN